jgi:hypothetical protein
MRSFSVLATESLLTGAHNRLGRQKFHSYVLILMDMAAAKHLIQGLNHIHE